MLINQEGLLKIVDFGVAAAQREGDTQLTKTGYVIGSPKYMAPEQILGKKVDERADIYAVGVILYEMITGVPPYSRGGRALPCTCWYMTDMWSPRAYGGTPVMIS